MPPADASLKAYYAARAREYERIYDKPERQPDLRRLERMIPAEFDDRTVLEIACGTGWWTRHLAQRARRVVATDATAETLEIARAKGLAAEKVSFEIADAFDLPVSLRAFDGAFAGFWWSHLLLRDRGRFLASLHRCLRPGATVVFVDNRYVEGNSTPIDRTDDDGNTYQRRVLSDGSEHLVLKNFPTENELIAQVDAVGTHCRYTALDYYWVFAYELR
jgi:SAM-dependent methyltransferase